MRTIRKIERRIPNLKQRKKVAAYARVSMESERMHHSLSAQVSYYSSLIQKNPDWEYAGVYADYGISGTGMKKRQEFLRMLEDAEAGKIDSIDQVRPALRTQHRRPSAYRPASERAGHRSLV